MNKFYNDPNYNCEVTLDSGETYKIFADWLSNENENDFTGWICSAGQTRLYIDQDLVVWSAMCLNDRLGTVLDFQIQDHAVCTRDRCPPCTDDLATAKHRPVQES